tara:strand:- start:3661 stop:4287 length:627 start_codon:yes stop_codon:yes gene_type:complete
VTHSSFTSTDHPTTRTDHHALRHLLRALAVPGFALLTALGAMVAVPLPPFGVPQTLQTLMVLLCALALGPRLGMASMLVYIIAGIVGVPLFAEGEAGLVTILGQTGGYLLGFVLCQPVAHAIIRRPDASVRGWGSVVVAGLAVHAVVFAIGVPWLYLVRNLDPQADPITLGRAVFGGFVVFIPGTIIKVAIATLLAVMFLPGVARRLW